MPGVPQRNGPDWGDVGTFIRAMHNHHEATVRVEITSDGALYGGSVRVALHVGAPHLTAPGQSWHREFMACFPCAGHATLEGLVYRLLHQADAECSRELWKQPMLPF